ncbi:unnamed protein product, partial [marine sediment metagenome]
MIIDANAFLGKWPFEDLSNSNPNELVKMMKINHINKTLVSPVEGIFYKDPQEANENLFKNIQKKLALIPIAVINPKLGNWEECINKNLKVYKIKGVKLHPNYHSYNLKDRNLKSMLRKLEVLELPVIFQIRMEDRRTHHPLMQVPDLNAEEILKLGGDFPNLPIILGGMLYHEIEENRTLLAKRKKLFIDTSFLEILNCIRELIGL